ncbi:MAG: MFS transporter [Caulobacteraceae bacterium]
MDFADTDVARAGAAKMNPHDRLSTSIMMRYGVGQVGAQIFRDSPAVLLPFFLTTMMGVPAWLGGLAILAPKLWIIFCDPMMGSLSDRKKRTWGRMPFLGLGAVLTAVSFFFLFHPVEMPSPMISAVYVSVIFLLGSTGFSAFSVPYLALASELTTNQHERTKLLAYRMVFTMVGIVLGVGFAQPLVSWLGGGAHAWTMMAAIVALICLATMLIPAVGLRKLPVVAAVEAPPPLSKQIRLAWTNKPFVALILTFLLQSIGQAISYSVIALIFIYALGNISLLIPFVLVMGAGTVISQPMWIAISKRYGKRATFVGSVLVWVAVTITWIFVTPNSPVLVRLPLIGALTTQQALALVRAVIIGVFNSGFVLMAQSMLTDTVAYDRIRFGRSSEGVFSGVFSATEKFTYACGPALAGIVLSLTGFVSSKGGPTPQSASAIHGILLNYSILPAALALLSLLVIRFYKLTAADLDRDYAVE